MEPVTNKSYFTPKTLIITGIVVIIITIGLNLAYSYYTQAQLAETDSSDDELPSGNSEDIEFDSFTFSAEDQKYSIDYPKGITVRELQKKYYQKSQRLFEGKTEFVSNKKTSDPEYFKMTINTQRIYRDDEDKEERLVNIFTPERFCPKGEVKKQKQINTIINEDEYIVTANIRGCGAAAYTTYYESFTQPAKFVIEIQSNQPFDRVKKFVDQLLTTLYLDQSY